MITLRALSAADGPQVERLNLETEGGFFLPEVATGAPQAKAWGLWKEDQLIGVVEVVGTGPVLWIARIGVDRAYRGLGYGYWALQQLLFELGRRLRVQELRAAVHKDNHPAHRLFQKAGFQPLGQADPVGEVVYVYRFR